MIIENLSFSSLRSNHCKGNKSFHHNHSAYQSKLFLKKNWMIKINATQKYCRKGESSTILLRPQTLTMGSRCNKNCFLEIYYHLSYTWVDLICSTYLLFFKSTWCLVWTFCTQNILEGGSILSSRITIFKELLFLVASVSECLW